ncbi:molecular chaperone DnaJ [Hamadaea flava]|uniref:Chaperone protein DnaJ n=1 Tax=Hamadaea flava TaxID=1742688 RepID=A0ABV8LFI6_9ACTN|nr:molecular chaperone DnaJ [Hamadaea flava]MCP2325968.1 molecular chaperone DnaJ [Hamadaea flava]
MTSKDWLEKDFYAVLGVAKNATADEIKRAYRRLARELHPDHNPGNPQAEERFKSVSEAYAVLSDDKQRREYDEMRSLFEAGAFRRGARTGGYTAPGGFEDVFGGDSRFGGAGFSDLFSTIFSGGNAPGATRRGPARGRDVETDVILEFREAVKGTTKPVTVRSPGVCDVCHGNGARPGTLPRTCPVCQGSGFVPRAQGAFSFSEPCRECQGVGTVVDEKCHECHGTGGVTKTRTLNVRIPAGVADGQRIRLAGRGEPGERGGSAGDLYVLARVRPDPIFGRSGDDLTLTVPIGYWEAAFGVDLRVPTLDGPVTLRVPAGTPSGRTLRVRGKGVARKDGRTGDLLVTVEIEVPKDLTADARAALENYAHFAPRPSRQHLDVHLREPSEGEVHYG